MDWLGFAQPTFWLAVLEIVLINILLSGDNAIMIALACRRLPRSERVLGMAIGAGVAAVLLIVFTAAVAFLMRLPYLQLIGGGLLAFVAVKLLAPTETRPQDSVHAAEDLWRAVRLVVVADVIMSLDNVVAVAAAARGSLPLLALGLCVSIPVVIAGAALIMGLLDRFPFLIWAGAALLGWIAGGMLAEDTALASHLSAPATLRLDAHAGLTGAINLQADVDLLHILFSFLAAAGVLLVGAVRRRPQLAVQRAGPTRDLSTLNGPDSAGLEPRG